MKIMDSLCTKITSSDIIAICSVIVAALAFAVTLWQAKVARMHSRLSVRPLLVWHSHRINAEKGSRISFSVRNHGLGPAIVTARYFTKEGNRFHPPGLKTDEVADFLTYLFAKKIEYRLLQYGLPGQDSAIPAGTEIVVADVDFPAIPSVNFDTLNSTTRDVNFVVEYKSLYEETFKLNADGKGAV